MVEQPSPEVSPAPVLFLLAEARTSEGETRLMLRAGQPGEAFWRYRLKHDLSQLFGKHWGRVKLVQVSLVCLAVGISGRKCSPYNTAHPAPNQHVASMPTQALLDHQDGNVFGAAQVDFAWSLTGSKHLL